MSLLPPKRSIRLPLRLQPQGGGRSARSFGDREDGPGPSTAASRRQLAEISKTTCGICRKRKSKYVCPRCNVFYCSLECFRDEKHAGCSEPFYAVSVRQALESAPDLSSEDKRQALETLQRFEAAPDAASQLTGVDDLKQLLDGLRDENGTWDQERADALERELGFDPRALEAFSADQGSTEECADELQRALDGLDLDTMDPDELLRRLPAKHRREFMTLMEQPDSLDARRLLEQIEADGLEPVQAPWWEEAVEDDDIAPAPLSEAELGAVVVQEKVAIGLLYNAVAIGLVYIALTRHHALNSLSGLSASTALAIMDDLSSCLPFLFDSRSTTAFTSVQDVSEDVASRLPDGLNAAPPTADPANIAKWLSPDLTSVARLTLPTVELDAPIGLERAVADLWRFVRLTRKRSITPDAAPTPNKDTRDAMPPRPTSDASLVDAHVLRAAERKLAFYARALQTLRCKSLASEAGGGRKALSRVALELEQAAATAAVGSSDDGSPDALVLP